MTLQVISGSYFSSKELLVLVIENYIGTSFKYVSKAFLKVISTTLTNTGLWI